jgi:two-component system, OmpR family, sensor histidine kinase BaeS
MAERGQPPPSPAAGPDRSARPALADSATLAAAPRPIALRLALAFLAVALGAVALLAGLTAAFASADVSNLASRQRAELTSAIAVAAGAAWSRSDTWDGADLSPVVDLATRIGADVQIRDQAGRQVASSAGFASDSRPQSAASIEVGGQRVGQAVVRFTGSGLGGADQALRTALMSAIAGAAGLAALLALLAGLAAARRITRPVERLIAVTRAMAAGDRSSRVGQVRAPGELRELAAAFDQMADALDRQDQLRRDLVADVAHELRTPIAVLQAEHEALIDGVTEASAEQLSSLRDEVLRLAGMVGDLQTLADADAAALRLSRSRTDLTAIASSAADSLAGRFDAAGITFTRHLAPVEVLADAGRLRQVITNLLTNALKFTPPGGRVTIEAAPANDTAVLKVTDTGAGIPATDLPRIFDRFWRGQHAAHTSGSGVGLAIAAELAHAHGGDLTAASTEGQGTQMTLTLPRARLQASHWQADDGGPDLHVGLK